MIYFIQFLKMKSERLERSLVGLKTKNLQFLSELLEIEEKDSTLFLPLGKGCVATMNGTLN